MVNQDTNNFNQQGNNGMFNNQSSNMNQGANVNQQPMLNNSSAINNFNQQGNDAMFNNQSSNMNQGANVNQQPMFNNSLGANNFNQQGNNGMFNSQSSNMNQGANVNQQSMLNNSSGANNFNQQGNNVMFNNQSSNMSQGTNVNQQPVRPNNMSYKNAYNNVLKSNKIKIIGIAVVLAVVVVVAIMLFSGKGSNEFSGGSKSGTTVLQGEELNVKNNFTDITFKVVSVERNVKLSSVLGALNNEFETFTKIKIDITNHHDKKAYIDTINKLKLLDSNKNDVTNGTGCYAKTWMQLYESVTDAIDLTMLANSTTSGYIYCPDEKNAGTILQLTSITEFDEELLDQDIIQSTAADTFYVNLK